MVQLPIGQSFEEYLLGAGFLAQMCAAADKHPEGDLDRYMKVNQGNKRRDQSIRDYNTANGKELGCLDFMKRYKGTIGSLLAAEMAGPSGAAPGTAFPPLVQDFFARLDKARGP